MSKKIRVLVADDITATRENIDKLMEFQPELKVVGQAATAEEAINLAKQIKPDVVLMDINMPGMDGITAAAIINRELPEIGIIMMSVQGEDEYVRQAALAGAENYLIKPFTGDELLKAVHQVYLYKQRLNQADLTEDKPGRVITVFSAKGGIGKTMIATNLAVALAEKTGEKVALLDGNLQFGDAALFLNLLPQKTIADLVANIEQLDEAMLAEHFCDYNDKVKVLAAPFRPEQADAITGNHLQVILKAMRKLFGYVIVDTAPLFNYISQAALEEADQVLIVAGMDLPTIKNIKLCLEIMDTFHYPESKVKVILNRANSEGGMEPCEVAESLDCTFTATLPSEGRTVVPSVNRGIPFVVCDPQTPIAQGIFDLAAIIASEE